MLLPTISVIAPVYNIENYIKCCVDSILAQTFTDFELLLIDDGSTDNSGTICDEYANKDRRVKVVHKKNGGQTSARNAGLEQAVGEWICHIDGDDWVSPEYLEMLISKAEAEDADIAECDFCFAYPDFEKIHRKYSWRKQGVEGLAEYIASGWTTLWGSIQKRRLYTDNGFKNPEGISYCEDFHLMSRLISVTGKVAKVNEPLYYYRQQPDSIMHNLDKNTMRDEIWVYTDTIEYFKSIGIYEALKEPMAWRTLKATQDLVLDAITFDEFRAINPDKRDYIWNCPFVNGKLKLMMWCLTHGRTPVTRVITQTRKLLGR